MIWLHRHHHRHIAVSRGRRPVQAWKPLTQVLRRRLRRPADWVQSHHHGSSCRRRRRATVPAAVRGHASTRPVHGPRRRTVASRRRCPNVSRPWCVVCCPTPQTAALCRSGAAPTWRSRSWSNVDVDSSSCRRSTRLQEQSTEHRSLPTNGQSVDLIPVASFQLIIGGSQQSLPEGGLSVRIKYCFCTSNTVSKVQFTEKIKIVIHWVVP